ncbi:MAG: Polysaccharide biosynthesis protein [Tenericutes bacterium ADurb.Bin239]|nr:MAG: Polysaccharide biosynthesis protein [Tenericutes bacterium ADurb.Bin239]
MQRQEMKAPVVFTLIRNVTIALLSFISFPFASQALGTAAMGVYNWANTFVYYFLIISRLGIPVIAIRECAKVKDDKEKLSEKVQSFFVLQLITTALSFVLLFIIMFVGKDTMFKGDTWQLIFLLSLNFLIGVFSFEWVYIALDRVFYMSVRALATTILGTLLIIIFVQNDHDLFIYAFINLIATFVTVTLNTLLLKREGINLSFRRKVDLRHLTKSLLFVFGITFLITAYNQNDSLLLGYLDDSFRTSGAYSVGIRGIEIVITIITSLSGIFVIRTTEALKNNDMPSFHRVISYSNNITFFIGAPAVLFMIGLSPEIVGFIVKDSPYWDQVAIDNAILAVVLLSSLMLTYCIHEGIYQQILVPLKREKIYFFTMLFVLIFNISLSVILALFVFKDNPLLAVALVTLLSEVVVLLILLIKVKEYVVRHIFNLNNLKIIVSAGVSLGIVLLIKHFLPPMAHLATIGLSLLVGGIIYVGLLFLFKEDLVYAQIKGVNNGES